MAEKVPLSAYLCPDFPHWDAKLSDGTQLLIRPVAPQDAAAERDFIESLSSESRYNRFLGQLAHPSDEFIHELTDVDFINDVALAAIAPEGNGYRIVGVSRYAVDNSRQHCECAVVVADAWQGKGLGTALMKCLIAVASERGLLSMQSFDLAENWEMRELAAALGFYSRPDPDDPHQVIYTLPLAATAAAARADTHASR